MLENDGMRFKCPWNKCCLKLGVKHCICMHQRNSFFKICLSYLFLCCVVARESHFSFSFSRHTPCLELMLQVLDHKSQSQVSWSGWDVSRKGQRVHWITALVLLSLPIWYHCSSFVALLLTLHRPRFRRSSSFSQYYSHLKTFKMIGSSI